MLRSIRAAFAAVGVAAVLLVPAQHAGASPSPTASVDAQECRGQEGQTKTVQTKHDGPQKYQCVQRKGEDCPHWRWVYDASVPKNPNAQHVPVLPCTTACPSSTPPATPSTTPSASKTPSPSPSASTATVPAAQTSAAPSPSSSTSAPPVLAKTGIPPVVNLMIAVGVLAVLLGAAAVMAGRARRRSATTE